MGTWGVRITGGKNVDESFVVDNDYVDGKVMSQNVTLQYKREVYGTRVNMLINRNLMQCYALYEIF